jgi:OOP family OmpA-OmpF porin
MKSKLLYSQFFGLLLLSLLLLFIVPKYTKEIPQMLIKNIENQLIEKKISWVSVRAEGRDITVSGIAPSIEAHTNVLKLIQNVFGVRVVLDKISPKIIIPYAFKLRINSKELFIEGYMPSVEAKKELLKLCNSHYTHRKIIDNVDVASGNPSLWNSFIFSLVKEMKKLDVALVNVVDSRAQISGKVKSQKLKKEFISSMKHFDKNYEILEHLVSMDEPLKVCQQQFNKLLKYQKIKFDIGKSTLKPESDVLIRELVNISALCPQANLEIIGHTDSLGNNEANKKLSLERSKAVVSKLFQEGVLLKRMHASGRGESEPIANNSTKEGRAKNRRIEFKVIMKEER